VATVKLGIVGAGKDTGAVEEIARAVSDSVEVGVFNVRGVR
jgi:hypothetical protein